MSWLSVKLGQWLHKTITDASNREKFDKLVSAPEAVATKYDPLDMPVNQTQFTILKVANGRLVKVSDYKPTKSHHSDWTHEIYIVKDDEKVPDVIARIMAIKALEQ